MNLNDYTARVYQANVPTLSEALHVTKAILLP
jgi:hypothetical protein